VEPRRSRRDFRNKRHDKQTGLSYGVANMDGDPPLDREGSKFLDFLMHSFLFILGGIILCGMIFGLLTLY